MIKFKRICIKAEVWKVEPEEMFQQLLEVSWL